MTCARIRLALAISFAAVVAPASAVVALAADDAGVPRSDGASLGFLVPFVPAAQAPSDPAALAPAEPSLPPRSGPWVRVVARWSDVEREAGRPDWSALEARLRRLRDGGDRIVLCLSGANPVHPAPEGVAVPLEPWLAFVRSAVRSLGSLVDVFEVWDAPARDAALDPEFYAFLLKAFTLALRAEARAVGATPRIAQGAVNPTHLEWQRAVWAAGSAAYVDIVPLETAALDPATVEAAVRDVYAATTEHPPASRIWAYLTAPDAWSAARGALRALASGADAAFVTLPTTSDPSQASGTDAADVDAPSRARLDAAATPPLAGGDGRFAKWVRGVDAIVATGYAPSPAGSLAFVDRAGAPLAGPKVLGRFVNENDLTTLVAYEAGGIDAAEGLLVLDVPDARDVRVMDPITGLLRASAAGVIPDSSGRRGIGVLFAEYPLLVRFKRASAARVEGPEEDLEVGGARGLTADEIIARHQAVQRVQDDRVERWIARGQIEFHFKLAQAGSTIDVAIDCNYFWRRGVALEWEQTDYYINGNRVTWKDFPEIPFVQPEKVATLPLDLTLDKTYAYRLVGEDEVAGRPAYVLEFEPSDPAAPRSLYRGRVWIDRERFVKLKTSLVQTQLEPPVLSNEEVDTFTPVAAGAGDDPVWLLTRTEGQQLWTVAARNLVVARTLVLSEFQINPPQEDFDRRLAAAYATKNQMLRDTSRGFKYLEPQPDGTRIEKDAKSEQWFAAAGAYKDESFDSVVPLAGVNWFDFDLAGRGIQANVFFAGVFLFGNVSWPNLFDRRIDGAAETVLTGIRRSDKVYLGDVEQVDEELQLLDQNLSLRAGVPIGQFFKATLAADLTFVNYSAADETAPGFVIPADHRVLTGTALIEFNRRRTSASLAASASSRSDWTPWGFADSSGAYPSYDPANESFSQIRATLFHEWYLPKFQKLRLEGDYLTGFDLDRFSKFRFGFFGEDRLNGFSGSGVRFDRGEIVRGGYAWNLFEVVRFDLTLERARVREDADTGPAQSFTGIGFSGNFVAPWKCLVNISYGRALASDIADLKGQQEFLLTVFKLF